MPLDPAENLNLIHRVLTVTNRMDDEETLFWRALDGGEVAVSVMCSDVFAWGCADMEDITVANIEVFESAARDVLAITPRDGAGLGELNCNLCSDVGIVFACRVRNARPFKHDGRYPIDQRLWPLLEAIPTKECK